jgi:NAD+ synthase (glutamine-hydrolysing)
MRQLRIGMAQVNATVGDLDGNFRKLVETIERARAQGVDVLAFPEMVITGYPPEDLLLKPSFIETAITRTRELLPHTTGMTVVVGTVDRDVDLYNAAAVLHNGRWVGTYRKRYLPNYGVFDENRYFMPGTRNPVFVRGGTVIGLSICEDIWYAGGPLQEQVIRGGAEVVINLSASPYHAGKAQGRRRMLCTRAADNLAVVCYANLVGAQDEIVYDGNSLIVDEQGQILAEGEMFVEDLVVADVELDAVFNARLHDPRLRKERALDSGESTPRIELPMGGDSSAAAPAGGGPGGTPGSGGGNGGIATEVVTRPALARRVAVEQPDLVIEVYTALVLATRDYVHKNGFDTVVLGLSGGVDSALTACIAVDAIGAKHVVAVSMPSQYTSGASKEDAEALARSLGIRFYSIPIQATFEAAQAALAPAFSGQAPDATEENLQARIRGNYLMALSNKFGWLVLTTGNKSEYSAGYSTLYGDMAGGFAVLKDVYKTLVYQLSHHHQPARRRPPIPERIHDPPAERRA